MGTVSLGPLAIPVSRLLILAVAVVMFLVAKWWQQRRGGELEGVLWEALLVGFVAARLGYAALNWGYFGSRPLEIVYFWQGGYVPLIGLGAAMVYTAVRAKAARLRRPALMLLVGAFVAWGALTWVVSNLHHGQSLESAELTLEDLNQQPVPLEKFVGRPTVVNLWATWCPPCRREMPLLQSAQQQYVDVNFVFVNEGEASEQIRSFLSSESLLLHNVLLDPFMKAGDLAGSRALPTTLFYDAEGRLVTTHLGELTPPLLEGYLDALGVEGEME